MNDAYEINHMWTADMKSNEEWSSQLWSQFLQLRKEAWKKFRTSTGLEPVVTSRIPVRRSTNWAMKPLTLGAGGVLQEQSPQTFRCFTTIIWYQLNIASQYVRLYTVEQYHCFVAELYKQIPYHKRTQMSDGNTMGNNDRASYINNE